MKDIIPAKKESPILGLSGMGGGVGSNLIAGLPKTTKYIDDIFSTYLWKGTDSARSINNGIDLSSEGGLTWIKSRSNAQHNWLFDTDNGADWAVRSDTNTARINTGSNYMSSFNDNGFSVGTHDGVNDGSMTYSSWSFRKQKGFFDIVTWTGNGATRQIPHSLGSVPGCIMVKNTSSTIDWTVWHRASADTNVTNTLCLNNNAAESTNNTYFDNGSTPPTATNFTVHTSNRVNANNENYVAYIFAGGESPAANARSVEFTGANDQQYLATPSALIPGGKDSNQFCIESWVNIDGDALNNNNTIYAQYASPPESGRMFFYVSGKNLIVFVGGTDELTGSNGNVLGGWHHVAWSYDGTTHRIFLDGTLVDSKAGSSLGNAITGNNPRIGGITTGGYSLNGKMSNFRVVHGQAVYTSSFKPSTVPLTTTSQGVTGTNCKALCFNQSNELANDGALGNLTNPGSATVTDHLTSPFDDPDGYKFGEDEDQNLIECGGYGGNGNSTYKPEINLGWEPQWVMIKRVDSTDNWPVWDVMRGLTSKYTSSAGGTDNQLRADQDAVEHTTGVTIALTPTGFKLETEGSEVNHDNGRYVYVAIRRPDGLVGKPAEDGTDAFNMDVGNNGTYIPNFSSGFPVDFGIMRQPGTTEGWYTCARLTGTGYVETDKLAAMTSFADFDWDSNSGWASNNGWGTTYQSWMWKRGRGFDVVSWLGNGVVTKHAHNLGQAAEFMIVKRISATEDWTCYHKGLNGGTNPSWKFIQMNGVAPEAQYTNYSPGNPGNYNMWNREDPTSTHFTIGEHARVNSNNQIYIALLFSSVTGISKVGYYDGSGSTGNAQNIGFQPRYILIKRINNNGDWMVFDSLRGFGAYMQLNTTQQSNTQTYVNVSATGFSLVSDYGDTNESGSSYIYYAHA